ncbi:S-adenosyl-L-methionine-dependent methyltransferase [Tricladium varicosporioides]|nr:S-adenosyl-L-methionine-dependent methyltransferase [Hymenoscyphus varicosporioides]
MAPSALLPEEVERNSEFTKIMHGKSAEHNAGLRAVLNKDNEAHRMITSTYVARWEINDKSTDENEGREKRKLDYMPLVNNYYDLATDFYEEGWAQSFHFCRFTPGEGLLKALARHEHYIAHILGIRENMTVLDVGCGVGQPAREIATFTGCKVVGLNNNAYQISRATAYAKKEDLADKVSFVQSDFMNMNFPDNTFDAVYAIEATCHAPSLEAVYTEIHRVLKPGGKFGVFEWVMTDLYNESDPNHRSVRLGIERGDGIANMCSRTEAVRAIQAAGFVLEHEEDLAEKKDKIPWWSPLNGDIRYVSGVKDLFGALRLSWWGRTAVRLFLGGLEAVRLAPGGTAATAAELEIAAESLLEGAKKDLFTPMYLMVGRKPEV